MIGFSFSSKACRVLVTALLTGFGSTACAAQDPRIISFAMNSWIGYAPLFVASHNKDFGAYTLRYVRMSSGINAALIAGDVAVADLSMNQLILDAEKKQAIKIFMPIDYSDGADAIVSTTNITSVKELRGKKIPLNTSSYSELLLSYALGTSHLSIQDVQTVDMPASDVPSALLGHAAVVGVTWSPHVQVITDNKKYHVLFSSRRVPGLISDSLCARSQWLKMHPRAATALIRGMVAGEAYIKQHPRTAFKIVAHYLRISPQSAQSEYQGVINPGRVVMYHMMTGQRARGGLIPYKESVDMVEKLMKETGKLPRHANIKARALLDPRYVKRAATT